MPTYAIKIRGEAGKVLSERAKAAGLSPQNYAEAIVIDAVAPRGPTLRDVARAAKVSLMAASYAMNGVDTEVGADTIQRVLAVAKKLKYRPNKTAQNLRRKRVSG